MYKINENKKTWKYRAVTITKFIDSNKQEIKEYIAVYKPIQLPDRSAYLMYIENKPECIYNLTNFGFFWFLNYETTKYHEYHKNH